MEHFYVERRNHFGQYASRPRLARRSRSGSMASPDDVLMPNFNSSTSTIFNLPLLDEPTPPSLGQYTQPHTKSWAAKIAEFDAFIFVTAEYNHGVPGALKNAIDFLFREWNDKAAGFVSYGGHANGSRAVEQLRLVMGELRVADVRSQVPLSLFTDFEKFSVFKPAAGREALVSAMLDEVVAWGGALQALRLTAAKESRV